MHKDTIPLAKPYITIEMEKAMVKVLRSGILSMGKEVPLFEQEFSKRLGVGHCLAVSSGTAGLHLALVSSNIQPGDEIIVSPFSFIASVNCVEYVGATPIFVDIEPETFGMDPAAVSQAITAKTKAILPTHVFGKPCQIGQLSNISREFKIKCIEDACEALGARVNGQSVGTFGDIAVFAFYPNKQMTTGEGGMIWTNSEETASLLKSLRNQGRGDSMDWLLFERLGYNYRMSEIHGALGYSQLTVFDNIIEKRSKLAEKYRQRFCEINEIILPTIDPSSIQSVYFTWVIRVPEHVRAELIAFLNKQGIQAKAYFFPCIHRQPYYQRKYNFEQGMLPVAEKISNEVVALPFFTEMSERQLDRVFTAVRHFFN